MLLYSLLPIAFFVTLFVVFYSANRQEGIITAIRLGFISATLIGGLFIVLVTEILSAGSNISTSALIAIWSVAAAVTTGYMLYKKIATRAWKEISTTLIRSFKDFIAVKIIIVFLFVSFVIALFYPPNNYDSMTYHMARVAHWMQHHSIAHYPTHIIRQLVYQPFAEWIILHLQVLTHTDRLANAVQLFFFAGCILTVSIITKELGGNRRQQLYSALFTCLIPMAVIQSNTTQNDIVVAYFVLCFVFLTIRLLKRISTINIILAGIALGLALLTKGTAYLNSLLFCCWFGLILLKDRSLPLKTILKKACLLMVVPIIALLLNSGHYYRNTFLTGSPLGNANSDTGNKGFQPKALAMVVFKDFLNHIPVTKNIKNTVTSQSAKWGLKADDPDYNFTTIDWMMEGFSFHEDYAQNFIHTLLIVALLPLLLFRKKRYNKSPQLYKLFVLTVYASSLLFCLFLKWQPWANRLETCLFILFCVPLAMELAPAKKWVRLVVILPMLGFGVAALFYNERHPLMPPAHSIFAKPYNSFIYSDGILECSKYINSKNYEKIGLQIGLDSWDYPYYKLLGGDQHPKRILKHVLVRNESSIYPDNFIPEIIIGLSADVDKLTIDGRTWYRTKNYTDKDGPVLYELKDSNVQ